MALVHKVFTLLTEESSAWLQFRITYKDLNLEGWKEFFDVDFPYLGIKNFEVIISKCGESDISDFFKKYKTPGQFLASNGSGRFVRELSKLSDTLDMDELVKIITDKYSKRK